MIPTPLILINLLPKIPISISNERKFEMKTILFMTSMLLICAGCTSMKSKSNVDTKKLPPSLRNAEVKTLWIPDKIEADRFEEGHFIYIIEKPSTWKAE